MYPSHVEDDLRSLTQVLWRYRAQLDTVEYHLDVQHLLVTTGQDRWLGRTADLLRAAVDELSTLDRHRDELVQRLGTALGRSGRPSLADLAACAGPPWTDILDEQLATLVQAVERVSQAAERTRATVEGGLEGVHELLRQLTGNAPHGGGYDHVGRALAGSRSGAVLFDDRA